MLRVCALTIFLSTLTGLGAVAEERVDFNRDIHPILSDKCFPCHGLDEDAREANLRFDILDDKEGPFRVLDGTQAIKPKGLEASTIWYRLTIDDESERMPPMDSHKVNYPSLFNILNSSLILHSCFIILHCFTSSHLPASL